MEVEEFLELPLVARVAVTGPAGPTTRLVALRPGHPLRLRDMSYQPPPRG